MRIVHLCEFSAGVCGVWNAVFETAKRQSKNHKVYVLSSNVDRGSEEKAEPREEKEGVKIRRFPVKYSLSSNYQFWDFADKLEKLKPNIIHAHVYRHPYTTKALKVGKKLGVPVVLTTHAPFNRKRGLYLGGLTAGYDVLKGRRALKQYDKVIAITQWERKHLSKLGVDKEKIKVIPNGIPEEFFRQKMSFDNNRTILFVGRLSPLKRIDTLIVAMKDLDAKLKLVGPSEEDYSLQMEVLAKRLGVEDKVEFVGPVFDLKEKIRLYKECSVFVLPSETEGMPQVLVEAMSVGRVVIGADNDGIREIIEDPEFLFKVGDFIHLGGQIKEVLDDWKDYKDIMLNNKKKTEGYNWNAIVEKIEEVYSEVKDSKNI